MDDRLWIVTVIEENNMQFFAFPIEWKARECCSHWKNEGYEVEMEAYRPANDLDKDWKAEAESTLKDLTDLSIHYNELKNKVVDAQEELQAARDEADKRVGQVEEELRIAKSDCQTLKEIIVRQAMRMVGM